MNGRMREKNEENYIKQTVSERDKKDGRRRDWETKEI